MRVLVFSDLHSNAKNILDIIQKEIYDRYIFAGDIFGYFPFNIKVLDIIRRKNIDLILGNHDLYFIRELYPELFYKRFISLNPFMLSSNDYDNKYGTLMETLKNYSQVDLTIFDSADLMKRIIIDDLNILICHGSPRNPHNEYIYPDFKEFNKIYKEYTFNILILGHTHRYFINEEKGRFIINPGSCTLPRGNDKPSYAVIETNPLNISIVEIDQKIEFRKVSIGKVEYINNNAIDN